MMMNANTNKTNGPDDFCKSSGPFVNIVGTVFYYAPYKVFGLSPYPLILR